MYLNGKHIDIRRVSHFFMFLGVAVFAFHGTFHPLFHSPHVASCAGVEIHIVCAELALPLPDVPIVWRHDALCPICHADFLADLPLRGAEVIVFQHKLLPSSIPASPVFLPEYFVSLRLRGPPSA